MILIRVDASLSIGLGHLLRCVSIAEYLKSIDKKVLFLSKTGYLKKLISDNGFDLILLDQNISIEDELTEIERIINDKIISTVLLDINNFYSFTDLRSYEYYLGQLKTLKLYLISFEDPYNCVHTSDIIVIPYLASDKQGLATKENTKYLLGLKYYVLRSEFLNVNPIKILRKTRSLLITMGGADPKNITMKVLNSLKDLKMKLNLKIVISDLYQLKEEDINSLLHNYPGDYSIIRNADNMARLMAESDIAIINSGLTKYETLSVGLPTVVISNNDYHSELMEDFDNYNVIIHLGEVDKLDDKKILDAAISLATNYKVRLQMSERGKSLLDGHGVERIIAEIPAEYL